MLPHRSIYRMSLIALLLCIGLAAPARAFSPTIEVKKIALDDITMMFDFTWDLGTFQLKHDESISLSPENGFTTYDISELPLPPGWELQSILIETDDEYDTSVIDLDNHKVTLDFDEGELMTVTFTNVTPEPSLIVLLAMGGLALLRRRRTAK